MIMYRKLLLITFILLSPLSHASETLIENLKKIDATGTTPNAAYKLGRFYREAPDGQQDCEASVRWFTRSADLGSVDAINELGKIYGKGCGTVTKDYKKSEAYLTQAAELGLDTAQNNLGFLLIRGWGGNGRKQEGLNWLLKAADQGYVSSYFNLGYVYHYGLAGRTDLTAAETWYQKAVQGGHKKAGKHLEKLHKDILASRH
ncbi:tetratricopeptide repeat protein [uncultured Neptuniibacter sp.]|uniref:tetratricopeptide repeat protein n=1 Tax=uncultured Neptuniibacter sp. TaxID=502143 RepID=UPI0026056325|nr:tetratricopeptide repeat protein [uncultured Neptuniibacter sp.]